MSLLAQDERLTRRVGAVTLGLIALACLFMVFVYDQIEWGSRVRVRVYFVGTGGLVEGAPFIVAGRPVGEIESIERSPRGASALLGEEEGIVATLNIDADDASRIARSGDIFVTSHGVLGQRFLEIGPPNGDGPEAYAPLRDGDELRGRDPPSLDRVLQRTWDNLMTAARFAAEVRPEFAALTAELDALQATMLDIAPEVLFRDDFRELVDESKRTYAALGGDAGLARIGALADGTRTTIGQARTAIAKLRTSADGLTASLRTLRARIDDKGVEALTRIEQAIERTRAAIDKVDPLLAQVEALRQHIERGDGSLLKLARDPEFPEDAKELGRILKRQPWKILDRPPR